MTSLSVEEGVKNNLRNIAGMDDKSIANVSDMARVHINCQCSKLLATAPEAEPIEDRVVSQRVSK